MHGGKKVIFTASYLSHLNVRPLWLIIMIEVVRLESTFSSMMQIKQHNIIRSIHTVLDIERLSLLNYFDGNFDKYRSMST